MCNAMALQALQGGVQAYSAYQGAKADRAQNNFVAAVADNNAMMADAAAVDAVVRGGEEANKVRRQGRALAGKQAVGLATSGVDIRTGAGAQLLDETEFFTELDATTVRNNAARQAWGFRQEAQDYRSNASMSRAAAKASSPGRAAGLSLLSSATSTGMSYAANPKAMTKSFFK